LQAGHRHASHAPSCPSVFVAKTERARQLEASRDPNEVVMARGVREEIVACDHTKYLAAQANLVGLIGEATVLIVQILERAIESFDSELNQLAVAREADMERL